MARRAMVVDLNRCVGCLSCVVACKVENDVEVDKYWNWVERRGPTGKFPDTEMYFMPLQCQHCDDAPCIKVCPTGASYKRPDGTVLVEKETCIGCETCISACPYNARSMDSRTNVAGKCTLCVQLTDTGSSPHCVHNCPGKARIVGDLDDSTSEAARVVREAGAKSVNKLKDSGNKPVGAYVLRKLKWQG